MVEKTKTWFNDETFREKFLTGTQLCYKSPDFSLEGDILANLLKTYFSDKFHMTSPLKLTNPKTGKINFSYYLEPRLMVMREFIKMNPELNLSEGDKLNLLEQVKHLFWKAYGIDKKDYTEKEYPWGNMGCEANPFFTLLKETRKDAETTLCDLAVEGLLLRMGAKIHFSKYLPQELRKEFKEYYRDTFVVFKEFFDEKRIDDILDSTQFIDDDEAPNTTPTPKLFEIKNNSTDTVLLFHKLYFSEKNKKLLEKIIELDFALCDGIIFDDCIFDNICVSFIKNRIVFKNCYFKGTFELRIKTNRSLSFERCAFLNSVNFDEAEVGKKLIFKDCDFQGNVSMKGILFPDKEFGTLKIVNSKFHNRFNIEDTKLDIEAVFEDLTFMNSMSFKGTELGNNVHFDKFSFISGAGRKLEDEKKQFVDVLTAYGYGAEISKLGLESFTTKQSKFDYDAYQVAYNSGFLKPEYAAYFLGKSKVYLAKKRTEDKKKLVRDSLPFKIDGRDVQYPVEALLAFKAKDWDTLKNLRKKYPIPTD